MESKSMVQPALKKVGIEEYLEMERASTEKHEYYKGEVFAMSGASLKHNRIQSNLIGEIHHYLKGKSCDVFGSDLRIHIPSNTLFTYPDAVIVCGDLQLLDDSFDTILNPTVVFEILSPSTQSYDRGDKFNLYRNIDSLKEYILIASETISIEQYIRQENGQWVLGELKNEEDVMRLGSIGFELPLTDLYRGVF